MILGNNVDRLYSLIHSCINILETSENEHHLHNAVRLLNMVLDELKMYQIKINKIPEE
jgi:hypothetical protein